MPYTPALYFLKNAPCVDDHHHRCGVFGISCAMMQTKLFPHACPLYRGVSQVID